MRSRFVRHAIEVDLGILLSVVDGGRKDLFLHGTECGDDGCGGSCGECGAGQVCAAGACADEPIVDSKTLNDDVISVMFAGIGKLGTN